MSPAIPVWPTLLLWLVLAPFSTLALSLFCGAEDNIMNRDKRISCYTEHPNSTINWTLVWATGQVTHLGSCFSVHNCTRPDSSNFLLSRLSTNSQFRISRLQRGLSGSTVICTEMFQDGSTDARNCTLRVLLARLRNCGSRGYESYEGGSPRYSCDVPTSSSVTWSLVSPLGSTTRLATCSSSNDCTTNVANITANHGSSYTSIEIENMSRDMGGTLQCTVGTETDSCPLDVLNRVEVQKCDLHVHRSNWSAEISCGVTGAYSTFENFGFSVLQRIRISLSGQNVQWNVFKDRKRATLTPYINSTDRKLYFRGTYTYTLPMPDVETNYTYILTAHPGWVETEVGPLYVERPVSPSVRCESEVVCVCSTPSVGKPQGRLVWLSGGTVLSAGQYGQTLLQLSPAIGVESTGLTLICQLDWAIQYNASLTLLTPTNAPNTAESTDDKGPMLVVAVSGYVLLVAALVIGVILVLLLKRRARESRSSSSPRTPKAAYDNPAAMTTDGL